MKKDSTFIRICLFIICLLLTAACTNKQQTKIRDEEHKTFYINGISAYEYQAVSNSLKNMGFTIDRKAWGDDLNAKDGILECDFRLIGGGFYYSAFYESKRLTDEQLSKLTYGLFDNLPSGFTLSKWLEAAKAEGFCDEDFYCKIHLEWYRSGEIKHYFIRFEGYLSDEDEAEVNKRLSALFPHSKINNSGYKTYYDDNGVKVYFSNDTELDISKSSE